MMPGTAPAIRPRLLSLRAHLQRPAVLAALALGAAWLVFLGRAMAGGVFFSRDTLLTHVPLRHHLHESVFAGDLPAWFPYESLGAPFIGQIIEVAFHPLTWLLLPLDPAVAVKWQTLAAYLVGLAGAWRLARALGATRPASFAGACAFAFGGYAASLENNLPYLLGLQTLPWAGWAALRVLTRRRAADAALLGVAWALVFLGGDAQSFASCVLLVAAAALIHPPSLRSGALLLLGFAVAMLLVGAELWPATAVFGESVRAGRLDLDTGSFWALQPLRLAALVLPDPLPAAVGPRAAQQLFGHPWLWAANLFCGTIALALAGLALVRRDRAAVALGLLALAGLLLALGDRGGLLPLARAVVPQVGVLRFPEKHLALFCVALGPLVALGCDEARRRPRRFATPLLVFSALLGALWGAVRLGDAPGFVWSRFGLTLAADDALRAPLQAAWAAGLAAGAVFLALAGAAVRLQRLPHGALLLPLLVFAELFRSHGGGPPTVPHELLARSRTAEAAAAAATEPGPPRVVSEARLATLDPLSPARRVEAQKALLGPDTGALFGISSMGRTNLPAFPARWRLLFGPRGARDAQYGPLFHACFRVVPRENLRPGDEPLHFEEFLGAGLARQPCRPRAYLAAARPVPDALNAAAAVDDGLDEATVVWEGGPALGPPSGRVRWLQWAPGRLALEVEAEAAAALSVAESWSPGWHARVDGAPAPVRPTNAVVLGVEVPAGTHRVDLEYRTPRLAFGLASSAVGAGLAAALLLRRRGPRPRGAPAPRGPPPPPSRPAGLRAPGCTSAADLILRIIVRTARVRPATGRRQALPASGRASARAEAEAPGGC